MEHGGEMVSAARQALSVQELRKSGLDPRQRSRGRTVRALINQQLPPTKRRLIEIAEWPEQRE